MSRLLLIVAVIGLLVPAWAQGAARLDGWSYHFDNRYLASEWADVTGHQLSDGTPAGRPVIFAGGQVVIDLDLGKLTRLAGLTAYVSRPNDNYKLRDCVVEARLAGQFQRIGVLEGFWGHTEQRSFALTLKDLKVETDAVRLVFNSTGALAVHEIEVLGQAVTAQAGTALNVPLVNDEKPSVREADVDQDGKPEVILENSVIRLIFWPAGGGVCRSFLYKPTNTEFVAPQGAGYGFLRDQLWSPAYAFAERPYNWRSGGDAQSAWLELSTTGLGGMMGFTHVTKRLEIGKNSPEVRVECKLQNDPSSQTDYVYGLWSHHFLGVVGQTNRYFYPTVNGVGEFTFDPAHPPKSADAWFYEPARGWAACCGANNVGLAATVDAKSLYCFYNWGGVGVTVPTFEWRYLRQPLKTGQSFATKMAFTPFQGLSRVDGVAGDVVGAVDLSPSDKDPAEATVRLQVATPDGKPVTGQVRLRLLPNGPWQDQGSLTAAPGKPGELKVALAALAAGAYVVNCTLKRGNDTLDDFERPFTRSGAALAYRREPNFKRVGLGPEEVAAQPRHDLTDAVVTPHVPWARPLAGGPLKALVLCDDINAREVIELKQRLDLDLTYVKFRTFPWDEEIWAGDRSIANPEQANARLLDYLKKNRYDLILLSGFDWAKHFTAPVREAITGQVKAGTGFVFIEPDGFTGTDELGALMGTDGKRAMSSFGAWQSAGDSPLTAGLPWELFPQTRYMKYAQPPQGQVLATIGATNPLLVTNQLGQGRTVVLTYDTLTHSWPYRGYSALTPILSYRGGFLRDDYKQMTWNYWEGWYALLCRVAVWAAGRDTGVQVVGVTPPAAPRFGQAASVGLRLQGGQGQYTVKVEVENRCRERVSQAAVPYTAGQGEVALPLPANLPAGVNLVSFIVRDPAGNSVAWGQTSVKGTAPAQIKSLAVEKDIVPSQSLSPAGQPYERVFKATVPLKVTAQLDLQQPVVAGLQARARLTDTFGRLLCEATRALDGSTNEVTFTADPSELRANGLQWEVALVSPQGQMDVARARLICPAPREWTHFRMTSWEGLFPWRSEYLYEYLAPQVEDLVDIAFHGSTELSTGHVWRNFWYDIDWSYLGLLGYMGQGVADFMDKDYAQKVAKYNQTKDKQYLVRTPCLEDQDWRGKMAAHVLATATDCAKYGGVYDFCMGDEMSLTYYTAYFDYDWDPRSLAAFRQWLQKRYGDLGALNKAWETDFATWEAVVPLTLDEAKQRPNAAPWCEFRDFMNDSLAGVYRQVTDTLKTVDPQARAGLSGTQEPRAGNGMDWWKNSQAFNFYHAYNTGWSNEMRRSFAPYTGVAQSPYYAGYWQAGRAIEYNVNWCLLHDTNALSAWTTHLFFYNDFTYSECGRDTLKLCHVMKDGLWDTIRAARRQHDGIAIHYSQDSINAGQLLAKEETQKDERDVWVKLLEDLGLQYDFVATPQIEGGLLAKGDSYGRKYKVLILPLSYAISDAEQTAIEAFVRGGGVVIADSGAGIMDGKCRKGSAGVLDGLFGIKRTTDKVDTAPGVKVSLATAKDLEVKLPVVESLSPAGATVGAVSAGEAKTPALLRNAVGQGAAWTLNLDLRTYDNERIFHSPVEKAVRQVVATVLKDAKVAPLYPITLASGHAPHIETVRYAAGDLTYLGLLSCQADPEEIATVNLGRKWHVYDCRAHAYLGEKDSIRAVFAPGACAVYCLSAKPLSAAKIASSTSAVAPGGEVKYTVTLNSGSDRARQCLHLSVVRPDGKVERLYARNFLLGGKRVTGKLQLAASDPPGVWKLRVSDLASGAVSEARVTVKPL